MAQGTGWIWHPGDPSTGAPPMTQTRAGGRDPSRSYGFCAWDHTETSAGAQQDFQRSSINCSSNEAELHNSSSNWAERENRPGNGTSGKEISGESHPSSIPGVQHPSSAFSCTKLPENSWTSQLKSLQLFGKIWRFSLKRSRFIYSIINIYHYIDSINYYWINY